MARRLPAGDEAIHRPAWDAFDAGTETACAKGLYGAGQELLKDTVAGNVQRAPHGLATAEKCAIRKGRTSRFCTWGADKTDPGACNLPLCLVFADPMNTPGLMLAPSTAAGLRFLIMDVPKT